MIKNTSRREALVEMAKVICDNDFIKAQFLLNLISGIMELDKDEGIVTNWLCKKEEKREEVNCLWQREGKCWVDMPDSIHTCNGKCNEFTDLEKFVKKY